MLLDIRLLTLVEFTDHSMKGVAEIGDPSWQVASAKIAKVDNKSKHWGIVWEKGMCIDVEYISRDIKYINFLFDKVKEIRFICNN